MKSRLKLFFGTLFMVSLIAVFTVGLRGQGSLPTRNIEAEVAVIALEVLRPACDLAGQIEEAKLLLKNSAPLKISETPKRAILRKEISLVILDTQTCSITESRYLLDEADVKKANALRRAYQDNPGNLPKFMPVDPKNEFSVTVNWWNNHNSDLSIVKDGSVEEDRYIVIANKFAISNDSLAYNEDKTGPRYSDIIYVPYSSGIHADALIELGKKFLNEKVDSAFDELARQSVQSAAYPSKLVTDVIRKEFPKNLFITEQTDPALIFASSDNGKRLAERVFIRLGANGDKTFRYTYSKTGALGLGQIMPGTYGSIAKRYPAAKLLRDIDIGRVDEKNGIKATILVLDDHFATVVKNANGSSKGRTILAGKTHSEIEEIMAAAYNGGPGKYKPPTGTISLAVRETVDFVRKFKMIRDLKLFD